MFIKSFINKATASVTNDYEGRKELRHPEHWRAKARFLLTMVMASVLVVAIVILVENQPVTKLSRETYKGSKNLPGFTPLASGPLPIEAGVGLVAVPVQCSCSRQSLSWNNFSHIFSITQNSKHGYEKAMLNGVGKYPDMCGFNGSFGSSLSTICITLLQAFIGNNDQRTFIQSTYLLPPAAMQNEVYIQMKTNLLMLHDTSQYLALSPTTDEEYIYYKYIETLIGAMIVQQWENMSSSIEDFWKRGKESIAQEAGELGVSPSNFGVSLGKDTALGITISWDAYEEMCHPKFCDHIHTYSLVSRIFHAASEVGGFFSIVLFVVRALVWPLLLHLLSHSTGKEEATNLPPNQH